MIFLVQSPKRKNNECSLQKKYFIRYDDHSGNIHRSGNIHCSRNIQCRKKYIAIEIIIVLEIFIAQAIFIVVDEARVDRGLITAAGSDFTECHSAAAYLPPRCC